MIASEYRYVQQLLLEEAAKLADAAVRQGVARAGSTPLASGVAAALRAPRRFADATFGRLPLPGPLRSVLDTTLLAPVTALDAPATAPALVSSPMEMRRSPDEDSNPTQSEAVIKTQLRVIH
jgi:hypothetical protein